ncbi:hypothetical protein [Burkholderia pyrrocinia]|uniref:hypothetical protein n=1 Tax=Burkholderia pyrrocinia TaxID=60550 RepID=UPI001374E389|nr:hypothetical protein [Burkholderia pyrrocinia]
MTHPPPAGKIPPPARPYGSAKSHQFDAVPRAFPGDIGRHRVWARDAQAAEPPA